MIENISQQKSQDNCNRKWTSAPKTRFSRFVSSVKSDSHELCQKALKVLRQIGDFFQNLRKMIAEQLHSRFFAKSSNKRDDFDRATTSDETSSSCSSSSVYCEIEPIASQKMAIAPFGRPVEVGSKNGICVAFVPDSGGVVSYMISNSPEIQENHSPEIQEEQGPEIAEELSPEIQQEHGPEIQEEQGPEIVEGHDLETRLQDPPELELVDRDEQVKGYIRTISEDQFFDMVLTHAKRSANQYLQVKMRLNEVTETHEAFIEAVENEELTLEKILAVQSDIEVTCNAILQKIEPLQSCKSEVATCERIICESSSLARQKVAEAKASPRPLEKLSTFAKIYRWVDEFKQDVLTLSD